MNTMTTKQKIKYWNRYLIEGTEEYDKYMNGDL